MARLSTGQMREETQQLLDEYNELYNWEYNDMCDFIESYGQTEFLTHYETYHRLVEDYGMELVTLFVDEFDIDSVENFEDMYEGHFETGQDFAEYWFNEVDESAKNIPDYVTIDYVDIWAVSYTHLTLPTILRV